MEGVRAKKIRGDTRVFKFLQGIWFHPQMKDGANTSSLRSPQSYNMILYINTKATVLSPDEDTSFFDIVAGDIFLAPYLFIIYQDYVLWMSIDLMKENRFTLKKASRWHAVETITDADYADDLARLVNALAQAESLLHSLKQRAGCVGLHVNADKTEDLRFNQEGNISNSKWRFSEISGWVNVPRKPGPIYGKWH